MSRYLTFSVKLLVTSLLCTGVWATLVSPKAHANHIQPPPTTPMTGFARSGLAGSCGHGARQSPAFVQWLSRAGQPAVATFTVPWGTPTVDLGLHFAGMICEAGSDVPEARLRTMGIGTVPANQGTFPGFSTAPQLVLNWGEFYDNIGHYRVASRNFTYAPSGGFTSSRLHTIRLDNRIINQFWTNNVFRCVSNGAQVNGFNFPGCPQSFVQLSIQINVTPAPVPPDLSCVSITTSVAGNPEVGQDFNLRFSFRTSGGTGPVVGYGVFVTFPAEGWNNLPLALTNMGRNTTATHNTPTANIPTPGTYSGFFTVLMPDSPDSPLTCRFDVGQPFPPVRVVAKPYHRVYGGDVFAGAGFGESCDSDQEAAIIGWNQNGPYLGSGAQLAAFALGLVNEFATAQLRTGAAVPKHLTFANTGPPPPSFSDFGGSTYGGGLLESAGTAVCAPDYFAGATGTLTGPVTIPARTLALGERQTIYVNGDATITGNIDYAPGSYTDISRIPSFRLIVRGNIYVAPNVQRLDGVYVAQPAPGGTNTGRFYTCWPGHMPTDVELNGTCRTNRLTVTGAVVAELIKLTRSQGSLLQSHANERYDTAQGSPAEVFIFSPEVWLTGGFKGSGVYDSVTALPPVL